MYMYVFVTEWLKDGKTLSVGELMIWKMKVTINMKVVQVSATQRMVNWTKELGKRYKDTITVTFNTDCIEVFDSSTYSLWPIFLMINELGLWCFRNGIRCNNSNLLLAGRQKVAPIMYCGNHYIYLAAAQTSNPTHNIFQRRFLRTSHNWLWKQVQASLCIG